MTRDSLFGWLDQVTDQTYKPTGPTDLPYDVGGILGKAFELLIVIGFALVVYAGFTWLNARGDAAEVKRAKNLLKDACIGLIIISAAYSATWAVMTYLLDRTLQ